jgi:hypothetical protein
MKYELGIWVFFVVQSANVSMCVWNVAANRTQTSIAVLVFAGLCWVWLFYVMTRISKRRSE